MNMFEAEISKLEAIDFNIQRIAAVLMDLYSEESHVNPLSLDYVAGLLTAESKELSAVFTKLHTGAFGRERGL